MDAVGVEEAVHKVGEILFPNLSSQTKDLRLRIDEVIDQALSVVHGEPYHRATLKKHAGYFKDWCQKRKLRHWEQLQMSFIREYAQYHLARACSRKTVLHYLEPIRLMARWAMEKSQPGGRRSQERLPGAMYSSTGTCPADS